MAKQSIVVLGAGVGGLAAAWFLTRTGQFDVTLVEQAGAPGGLCASFKHDGYVLDHGPHKIYSVIPGILDEITGLMGDRLLRLRKQHRIMLRGQLLDYPLRLGNISSVIGAWGLIGFGTQYAKALASHLIAPHQARSYEEYLVQRFGRGAYQLVFEPLAEKVWGDPATLHPEMARVRIPASGAVEVVLKMLKLKSESADRNADYFYYPRRGFGDFVDAMVDYVTMHDGRLMLNATPTRLERLNGRISAVWVSTGGRDVRLPCDYLVSSIPQMALGKMIYGNSEPEFDRAVAGLQFRHLNLVYLFVRKPEVLKDHWVFFPERKYVFSRIFEQRRLSAELVPQGRSVLCCDFTSADDSDLSRASDEDLVHRCVEGVVAAGFLHPSEVDGSLVIRKKNFYPRYDLDYHERIGTVTRFLRRVDNLLCTGRIGMYNYNNSDHCVDMGRFIAAGLTAGSPLAAIWEELEDRVATYQIVD